MTTLDLLDRLVAFPTVSRDPNRALIDFVRQYLADLGIEAELFEAEGGHKANLFATLGPADVPGILLSGHTDVVPVDGQPWTTGNLFVKMYVYLKMDQTENRVKL